MTRHEMLDKMNLSHEEHVDLMEKFEAFHASLNHNQRTVVTNSLISLEQARTTFGPGATVDDVASMVGSRFAASNSSCNGANTVPAPRAGSPGDE
jgi:predicted metal-binding transcription factor (methanogenesis marker protein 9)